jgi:hypothetical protein
MNCKHLVPLLLSLFGVLHAGSLEIANPTRYPYTQALIRLNPDSPVPDTVRMVQVKRDGQPVVSQLESVEGGQVVWVAVDLESGERAQYSYDLIKGNPGPTSFLRKEKGALVLTNGRLSVKVPSEWSPGMPVPAPILSFSPQGKAQGGKGEWISHPDLRAFKAEVLSQGALFAKVRLSYSFDHGSATVDVLLPPGKPYAVISSRHNLREDDGWRLVLAENNASAQGVMRRWYKGPFQAAPDQESFALNPGVTRLGETVIELQPRWTQSYDEGWSFGVKDPDSFVGAAVIRAGQWRWPHDNKPKAKVRASGDWAALDLPTYRGQRMWLLLAGDADLAEALPAIVRTESFLNADKLTHTYRLPFQPGETKLIGGENFYSNQTNPTGVMRQQNRRRLDDAAKGKTATSLNTLYMAQAFFDPDWYGDMEDHWSPINPNFYTDFIKGGIALTVQLRDHPEFPYLRQLAEDAFRKDVNFSVTLPGGAGQECPGYQEHAMSAWLKLAQVCSKYLNFDPREWPRFKEGARFLAKISVPSGGSRTFHPAGDTHPGRPEPLSWAKRFGISENPRSWVSEEFPGFGAVLRNASGTSNESYLSFKAGPNRGHYHGDQLSIHWLAGARPLAVDHHASYKPRPGQEHMHNRVSFTTDAMAYANMDGHERLIAFRTSPIADVAVGEVSSSRLREVKKLPPEEWDVSEPQVKFELPLTYRRTVILLKGGVDLVVMRDQFSGPEVSATWNLHVLGDQAERKGDWINFGQVQAFLLGKAGDEYETFPWEHSNGGREKTTAARLTRKGASGEFISVLIPGGKQMPMRFEDNTLELGEGAKLVFAPDGGIQFLRTGAAPEWILRADDIQLDRSQGDVGLFVPDVGYPFGPLPQWLIKQRADQR